MNNKQDLVRMQNSILQKVEDYVVYLTEVTKNNIPLFIHFSELQDYVDYQELNPIKDKNFIVTLNQNNVLQFHEYSERGSKFKRMTTNLNGEVNFFELLSNQIQQVNKLFGTKLQPPKSDNYVGEYLQQLTKSLTDFLEKNTKEISQITNMFKDNEINFPILKGTSWLKLLSLLEGLNVDVTITRQSARDVTQRRTENTNETYEKVIQYNILNDREKVLIFTENKSEFKIIKVNTMQELPDEITSENSFAFERYEEINYSIVFDIETLFEFLNEKVFNNKQEELPDSVLSMFLEDKFKNLQIEFIHKNYEKTKELVVTLQGNRKSQSWSSNQTVITFKFDKLDNQFQKNVYDLIKKYYIGNLEIKLNIKEVLGELADQLLDQEGIIGAISNQIQQVHKELMSYMNIFKKGQELFKKISDLFSGKQKSPQVRIRDTKFNLGVPEQQSDEELTTVFSPQTQSKQIQKTETIDNKVLMEIEEHLKKVPFGKLLLWE